MNIHHLQDIKKIISDIRFMQAAALVSSGLADSREARAYVRKLAAMDIVINDEIKKALEK